MGIFVESGDILIWPSVESDESCLRSFFFFLFFLGCMKFFFFFFHRVHATRALMLWNRHQNPIVVPTTKRKQKRERERERDMFVRLCLYVCVRERKREIGVFV